MPIVRYLSVLIKKAKSVPFVQPVKLEEKSSTLTAIPPSNPVKEEVPASVQTKPVVAERPSMTYVIATRAGSNVRSEPSEKSRVITSLKKEQKVQKLGQSGNWYNILLLSGDKGWIHKDLVRDTD